MAYCYTPIIRISIASTTSTQLLEKIIYTRQNISTVVNNWVLVVLAILIIITFFLALTLLFSEKYRFRNFKNGPNIKSYKYFNIFIACIEFRQGIQC